MRKLLLLTFACLFVFQTWAQNRTVTGKVTDEKGTPLSNVTVAVKGSKTGAATGTDGTFRVSVGTGATLIFSSVGFVTQEIKTGTQATVNISLAPASQNLQEVVVTALGIARDKRSLGYATQNITADQIADKGEVNLVNALNGKVAGVDITGASGSAGASANINIRGISSFNQSNQPLFIVDGIPISNDLDRTGTSTFDQQPANRALDLNVNDIESVNVLKGPAASALYGSRAAAGAIIITTKRGTGGKGNARVTLSSSYSTQKVAGLPEFQNEYGGGTGGFYSATATTSWGPKFGATPTLANGLLSSTGAIADYRAYPNNIKGFFGNAPMWDNNVNVSSGDAKQNYNFSVGNVNQKGILPNTSLNRTNVSVKFNTSLTDKVTLGASVSYISSKQVGILQGNGTQSGLFSLFAVPRSFDLDYYKINYQNADGSNNWPLSATRDNPYYAAYKDPVTSKLTRTIANVRLGYDILPWLNASYRLGIDAYTDRRKKIVSIGSFSYSSGAGRILEDNFFRSELNGDLIITAKKNDLFTRGLNLTALVGQNINNRVYQNVYVEGDVLSIPDYYNVSNAGQFSSSGETNNIQRLLGYYAQVSLAYNNYLFLELTGRADNSSTLPKNKNTYFYPSVSAGFVFTDALNLKSKALNYGKIRASYARVGRDAPPYYLQNTYETWSFGNNVAQFIFPYGSTLGFSASSSIANPNLSPEFTSSYEVGFNLSFLNSRITVDAAYFNQVSKDQIVKVGIPYSTGYGTQITNIGKMTNKGIELLVTGTPVVSKNFKWDISANFTRIRNKVVSIGNGTTSFNIDGSRFTGAVASVVEGEPYGIILGNKLQRSTDGQILINPATGIPLGVTAGQKIADPNRDWTAGITNTLTYKGVFLSFLFDYKKGGDIYSWSTQSYRSAGALKETAVDRDKPRIFPGVIQTADGKYIANNIEIPAQTYWQGMGSSNSNELGVLDATVLRLRELSLGYDLSGKMLGTKAISNIRFTLFARNIFFYAPNSPIDPEINTQGAGNIRGLELQSTPSTRTMGGSLRVTF
jgi:TonB-linked SusC/RagA family outer membrane protein